MNALAAQFLAEAREALDEIAQKLMALENTPNAPELLTQLFRLVHTLKGNCGLFDLPEMARVLHAGEDVMAAVRNGELAFTQTLADQLLDAMDFVRILCDEMEAGRQAAPQMMGEAVTLAQGLRSILGGQSAPSVTTAGAASEVTVGGVSDGELPCVPAEWLARLPSSERSMAAQAAAAGTPLLWLHYRPSESCFFQGEDPLHQARQTPGQVWGSMVARAPWPALDQLDAYQCQLDFHVLTSSPADEVLGHFRYVSDQITVYRAQVASAAPNPSVNSTPTSMPKVMLGVATPVQSVINDIVTAQRIILSQPDSVAGLAGRLQAATLSLQRCLEASHRAADVVELKNAEAQALAERRAAPLAAWLQAAFTPVQSAALADLPQARDTAANPVVQAMDASSGVGVGVGVHEAATAASPGDSAARTGRRTEETGASKTLRVEQEKIDRLMNLIGELVVARNALPYLASRAETVFGVRDLAREVKSQHAVIHRISEEMQDAIMQIRMMPVSFIFQRFPRLVRDTSRRLGKEVQLVLEGESTAADKNVIESLGDPLVHIIRNSLDHGFELPQVRVAAGKRPEGLLTISARQDADRVFIEISDDGKGIDPEVVKRKAYQNGLIDEAAFGRMSDEEAVNLIFLPGFSTAEAVSDLSGRGVGMDVVRTAIERVNGTLALTSVKGRGTHIRLSLPLSMAVSTVMTVECDGQKFGVPMSMVEETMRIPRSALRGIKQQLTAIVRGRVVPLRSLNRLLQLPSEPLANEDDMLAVLVMRIAGGLVGILVDDFHQTADIILKPMTGVLSHLRGYSGSALMGDGSVLMVLNVGEMLA